MADYLNYVLSNPDLRENAEAAGLTNAEMAEWGQIHYENHGKNEGRQNTPTAVTNPEGYTQTLGARHYQGRDPNEVLQASVRAGDPSEMWEAREDIRPEWNLGQYTAEGWNLAPDVPYKRGILGDAIKIDEGVGQLWSEGDKRFLQDRYEDAAIANDFPVGWVGEEGTWKGPEELAGHWSDITNAVRNEAGELRAIRDRPSTGWAGTDVLGVGDRWSGNVRPGVGVGNVYNPGTYTQPASPDFSGVMPSVNYSPQFEALTAEKGKYFAPWSEGQATPSGLLNYQVPGVTPSVGTSPSVTYTGANPSLFNTDTSGSAFSSGSTTTDASGGKWVMTPQGNWVKAGSDYGQGLTGQGRLFYDQHYDSSGAYVGSEGSSYDNQGWEMTAQGIYTGAHVSDLSKVTIPGTDQITGEKIGWGFTPYTDRTEEQAAARAGPHPEAGTSFFDPSD